jgi:hypothetical protein
MIFGRLICFFNQWQWRFRQPAFHGPDFVATQSLRCHSLHVLGFRFTNAGSRTDLDQHRKIPSWRYLMLPGRIRSGWWALSNAWWMIASHAKCPPFLKLGRPYNLHSKFKGNLSVTAGVIRFNISKTWGVNLVIGNPCSMEALFLFDSSLIIESDDLFDKDKYIGASNSTERSVVVIYSCNRTYM